MAQSLEDMGIAGKSFLQEALTNTNDPLGAIEEFQQENSILLPSLQPALPLLDLHDLKRSNFHCSVFEVLRDRLLTRIAEISKSNEPDSMKKLEAILDKSFPLNKIDTLLPVSMCLLKHLPKVPERYITALTKDQHLYKSCPMEVKRQIWQKNQTLFGDEVLPLLTQYIKEKEAALLTNDCATSKNFFTASPKSRRQAHVVKVLTEMIGKNIRLYDMVLQFLRTLFLKTHNVHYCSLRAEILMSLHDLEVTEVCSVDPCYKFTWCLDACIREHFVDVKRARELQGFLDSVRKGHEQVLGDLSMILCDPFAVNTMLCSVMKIIHDATLKETLPRHNTELSLLIRMLALGQSAWDIINKQVFKEPRVDSEITSKFIPSLMSLSLHDHIVTTRAKVKNLTKLTSDSVDVDHDHELVIADEPAKKKMKITKKGTTEDLSTKEENTTSLLHCISKFMSKDQLSRILVMWYTLQLIKSKRKSQLLEILPIIGKSYKECASDSVYVHVLTANFTTSADLLSDDALCKSLFNKFLFTKSFKEIQHKQLLQLVTNTSHKIPSVRLKALMTRLEPKSKKASEQLVDMFEKLKAISTAIEMTPSEVEKPKSPSSSALLGVPTPAAL
ncbi:negative elongation factor B-like [Clavelina lepadiformis]|uniref:negative elongation factor B-like n=1 Tax=Clavelina lepadiformis TaxID=159417 RepID=UPI004041DAD8